AAPAVVERPAGRASDPREDTVSRRVPLPPKGKAKKDRTRSASILRTLGFFAVFGLPLLLAAFIASQSVYFVGTNDDGFVTLYRGLPYDGPVGIELYTPNFVSGVATRQLSTPVRETVADHELRSREDGEDLVRQIELGRLQGQGAVP
ncbi:MAG: Stp1/IreP family PP2C-type Ser/Thr phosphatase, partial [Solirubrobacterales bacterium]|nr:Stp1/IreP family PP2C-type Ser/Thr phosphatase [Solirubrobacterales bacterium]